MIPRLLLNENFPAPSTGILRAHEVDALSIAEAIQGASDDEVLRIAVAEGRWIVTFDRDYGELIFRRGAAPPPAVVLLRVRHYAPQEPADWVLELLRTPEDLVDQFVVFTRDGIRKRLMLRRV